MTDDGAHHARNQAIAVLAIATAVLGFGLFSIEFRGMAALANEKGPLTGFLHAAAMFVFAIAAFMFYTSGSGLKLTGKCRPAPPPLLIPSSDASRVSRDSGGC